MAGGACGHNRSQSNTAPCGDKLVVTLSSGDEARSLEKFTAPLMEQYADRCSADFTVLRESAISDRFGLAQYEKYQIRELLGRYSRVLFIDVDILVSPRACDVFESVPANYFAATVVDSVFENAGREKALLNSILGPLDWRIPYFNSGVFLIGREHSSLLDIDDGIIDRWVSGKAQRGIRARNDQSVLNYKANLMDLPFFDLGADYNFTRAFGRFETRFRKSFIHYAGMNTSRRKVIEADAEILANPISEWVARRIPALVWILDRARARL